MMNDNKKFWQRYAPFYSAFMEKAAKYTMHIEPGMCHCYPMVTFFPEGKRGNDELIRLLM